MVSEGMKVVIQSIDMTLVGLYNVYIFAGLALMLRRVWGQPRWPLANLLWYWAKWPALVSVFFSPISTLMVKGKLGFWDFFNVALCFYIWWTYRDYGDDDDHKKLKKKLKDKVHAVGGKLVVVPEPA